MTCRTKGQWLEMLGPLFALGLSQREVAMRVGLSRSRVSEVCRQYGIVVKRQARKRHACPHCGQPIKISVGISS